MCASHFETNILQGKTMSSEIANFGIALVGVLVAIVTFAFANGVNKTVRFLVGSLGVLVAAIFGIKGFELLSSPGPASPIVQTRIATVEVTKIVEVTREVERPFEVTRVTPIKETVIATQIVLVPQTVVVEKTVEVIKNVELTPQGVQTAVATTGPIPAASATVMALATITRSIVAIPTVAVLPREINLFTASARLPTGWGVQGKGTYWQAYFLVQDEPFVDVTVLDCTDNEGDRGTDEIQVIDPDGLPIIDMPKCSGNLSKRIETKSGWYRIIIFDRDTTGNGGEIRIGWLKHQMLYKDPREFRQ
jgi:hypothetical protein